MANTRVPPDTEEAVQTVRSTSHRVIDRASEAYDSAAGAGRAGYEATAQTVAEWPFSSLLIAVGVGIGLGWALRASAGEQRRTDWLDALPARARRRIGY